MRRLLDTLDVPELEPVPRDHVLTKTFFIVVETFPGRHANGQTWTEMLPPADPTVAVRCAPATASRR